MASFLEDVNQMVIDAVYQDIAEQLLDDWINNNLDEGQYYADKLLINNKIQIPKKGCFIGRSLIHYKIDKQRY